MSEITPSEHESSPEEQLEKLLEIGATLLEDCQARAHFRWGQKLFDDVIIFNNDVEEAKGNLKMGVGLPKGITLEDLNERAIELSHRIKSFNRR